MPDELEQQLAKYGRTLAAEAESRPDGGQITSGRISERSTGRTTTNPGSGARRWAILGAAACVAALVAGLATAIGRDDDQAPAAAPGTTTGVGLTTTTSTTSTTSTTVLPLAADPTVFAETVPPDPLGLEADGWTLVQRDTEPFSGAGIEQGCPGAATVAGFDGAAQVHDTLTPPAGNGLDLDITVVSTGSGRGTELAAGIMAIGDCIAAGGDVEVTASSLGDSGTMWFRAGPDFALAAVAGDPITVLLEIEGAEFDDTLITDLIARTTSFLADSWPAAPTITTPALQPDQPASRPTTTVAAPAGGSDGAAAHPEVPRQQATAGQTAALSNDPASVLSCDELGAGGAGWDYPAEYNPSELGRQPIDALDDVLDQSVSDAARRGGDPYPTDGWTELVVDATSSYFVLEVNGLAQAVVVVEGDPEAGVWRAWQSVACQSLFTP
jgi:hypothetical protein